ncbi:hypothetical protein K474DRAFT_1656295 [Panus rudis PR-1116 ss-1]|nr:hypothetical protein K474DRAFT_1656295 [Panus rudis PR-1116 ss-1]
MEMHVASKDEVPASLYPMNPPDSDRIPSPPPSLMDRLPVELLIEIFVHCAQGDEKHPFIPLTLSHVCREWRDIAYASPRIWQHLLLDDRRSRRSTDFHTQWWASHSRSLPLYITLHVSDHDRLIPLILPLFRHLPRWHRFTLTGKVQESIDFSHFMSNGTVMYLDEMRITVKGVSELEDMESDQDSPHLPSFITNPSYLISNTLHVAFRWSVVNLPTPSCMMTFTLRNLTIAESSFESNTDPISMLQFLAFFPTLEMFHYHGIPHEPSYPEEVLQPPVVSLPLLRTLVIRSSCAVRTILSHIDAPRLVELYLEHTNMELDPDKSPPYPYAYEDGDSDDEASDFSQSPWSDHATGMGLRSLMRRSNPPLEVLAMDYADMRTKDFRWCFDRMVHLQEFRIVASDMSNKVIAMLAPYRGSGESNDDEEGSPILNDPRPLRVRLPQLSVLELWNCQRLSGDAIVHALQARVRYTDQIADGTEYRRLSDLGVIGCVDFTHRHAMNLRNVVGARLRTS